MSQNIFDATLDPNNDVKVNNFDWSHANNLTTQIGRVTPIFCDLVPAKTSFRVNPRFGLQFMPMVFPIQTRMKARISWYRYPVRALWKDYKDFVGNFREGLEEPYINFNTNEKLKKMASTGSLGDYLGLPTTLNGAYGLHSDYSLTTTSTSVSSEYTYLSDLYAVLSRYRYTEVIDNSFNENSKLIAFSFHPSNLPAGNAVLSLTINDDKPGYAERIRQGTMMALWNSSEEFVYSQYFANEYDDGNQSITFTDIPYDGKSDIVLFFSKELWNSGSETIITTDSLKSTFKYKLLGRFSMFDKVAIHDVNLTTSPWYNSGSKNKDKQQKILAYGFRAYEGICNAYIRDNRNNPYYLNGQVQYNKWIPSDEGGEDNNLYELRYANWEKDFLTTAVQSPQQGNAPLVGITTYAQTVANEDGTTTELVKTALVDEDGKKYGLSFKTSDEGLEGVEYIELDNGTQVRQARSLYDLATSGISIPDLRMVNCYQKFLELNMRKGYSYKDIVEGRFDVKVRYADLLMPEFFGGVSRDIDVNSVTQTVDQNIGKENPTYAEALGSQSGIAGVRGEANANIECFCDEESIIMGILIVTPLPVYTQLLPKHFTYRGLMEHYQPEFNLIGFQPIKYNEVCPIQAYNDNPNSLTETFGYNRPWYEYAQKYDVAHGLFRTDLSNFLMHRVFNKKPELSQSFLLVDPEQVTDVFAVTETTDKIYGQIWLDITCKLPIARVAIPRLD